MMMIVLEMQKSKKNVRASKAIFEARLGRWC